MLLSGPQFGKSKVILVQRHCRTEPWHTKKDFTEHYGRNPQLQRQGQKYKLQEKQTLYYLLLCPGDYYKKSSFR